VCIKLKYSTNGLLLAHVSHGWFQTQTFQKVGNIVSWFKRRWNVLNTSNWEKFHLCKYWDGENICI